MPVAICADLQERIIEDYLGGKRIAELARMHGVGTGTVKRLVRRRRAAGELDARPQGSRYHINLLSGNGLLLVQRIVREDPRISYGDLAKRIADEGGPPASEKQILWALEQLGIVRVKMRREPAAPRSVASPTRYKVPTPAADARTGERRRYPSDLTDMAWAIVAPFIPEVKPGGRPAIHSRRDLLDAMLYVLRAGCAWRMLPHDFPPWKTVYTTFRRWRLANVFERLNEGLRPPAREQQGRNAVATAWVIDSQSVKTTEKGGPVDLTAARR